MMLYKQPLWRGTANVETDGCTIRILPAWYPCMEKGNNSTDYRELELFKKREEWRYSYKKIDSYNALMNFIISARGDGTTYGYKLKVLEHYFQTGRQGLYLRRTEGELKKAMATFTDDLSDRILPFHLKVKKDMLLIARYDEERKEYTTPWECVMHFAYLANALKFKSVSYADVDFIGFDEVFIYETKDMKYVDDECTVFLNFYETVARMRDVKCYFISNSVSSHNPYFYYWNIVFPSKPGVKRISQEVVIELADDERYREKKKETRFGKLVAETDFGRNAFDNEIIIDTNEHIGKKDRESFYWATIYMGEEPYAVYANSRTGIFYISPDVNEQCSKTVEFPSKGRIPKSRYGYGERYMMELLVRAEMSGHLVFENTKCKAVIGNLILKWR